MTDSQHPAVEKNVGPAIREADIADLDDLLALWMDMMSEHERFDSRIEVAPGARSAYRAYLSYHLSQNESRVSVATLEGESSDSVVGFCLATINRNLPMFLPPHYGYLSDIVVGREFRRAGVGSKLVDDVKQWFTSKNISSVQLQVYANNETAEAFWRAQGFEPFYVRMWHNLSS